MYNCYKILLPALMLWSFAANSQTAKPSWYKVHPRVMMSSAKLQAIKKDRFTSPVLDSLCRYEIREADHVLTLTPPAYKQTTDEEQLWQREVGNYMPILAMAYKLTGDSKYLDASIAWAKAAMTYPTWGWGGTDLGAGHLLFGMASVYDWCYDKLEPAFRQQLEEEMLKRGRIMYKLLQPGGSWMRDVYLQNHLWVTNGGIFAAAVSLIDKYPEVQPWIDIVREKHRKTFELLGPDGASHEGVAYWTYGVEYLLRYMEMARDLYGEDNYTSEWFKKTARYYLGLALPTSAWSLKQEIVDIGDCPRKSYYGPSHILRKLAAEYNDGYAQQRARELDAHFNRYPGSEWQGLLWYNDKVRGKSMDNYPVLSFYEDMGIVGSRTSWKGDESLVVFKCAPPIGHSILKHHSSFGSAGHVHPDAASFSLFGHGRFLVRNPGYAIKRTHYQNTLTVNGKGQKGEGRWFRYEPSAATEARERKITMNVVKQSAAIDYFIGDAAAAYEPETGLQVFKRHMVFLKSLSTLVILDEIQLDKPGTATLHFRPEVAAERVNDNTLVSRDSLATLYIKPLTAGVNIINLKADTLYGTGGKPFFLPMIKLNYENSSSVRSAVALQWDGDKAIDYRSANDIFRFNIAGAGELVLDIKKQTVQWSPSGTASTDSVPKPDVPVYTKLKPLHIPTALVASSTPRVTIYAPGVYAKQGMAIQAVIKQVTGVSVPLITSANAPAIPLQGNLITLGNRSDNAVISKLYDRGFTYLDLKYPGKGGYLVRSLHNPYGNGFNVLFAGGSDMAGVQMATDTLIAILKRSNGKKGSLTAGYLASIQLANGSVLPNLVKDAEIWDASTQYNSSGYFGWNSVSKSMALYYMTGEERYRKEFLRLAYPDTAAIREMEINDGELVENKSDPLSGPYHYGAYMMICLWDLIEESPAFSNEERLRITNSLARQLMHRVTEYGSIYYNKKAPAYVGDRHDDWAAFSLYVLSLYFNRDYPDAVWKHCVKAADLHFSSLTTTSWTASKNDHLFWFTTFYDPMVNYLLYSGKRDATRLANLRKALQTQEIIYTGAKTDWGLKTSSVAMLNKIAYLLNDGRWLYMRQRNGVNTDSFRLGQSYWPGANLQPKAPVDLVGKWTIRYMPPEMWQTRDGGIPLKQSYRWGSYRSEVDERGDFVMIKGYNGAGRNPYHSFDILELRLNGVTLLKGYHNQVWTNADGMVEPKVAMDAKLIYQGTLKEMVTTVNEVPDLPFVNWRRTLALRKKQYVLITDELTFETNSENLVAETTWETAGAKKKDGYLELDNNYELHTSEKMDVQAGKITTMYWKGVAEKGKRKVFFHLLAPGKPALACLQLQDNVAALALPAAALAIAGDYKNTKGEIVIIDQHAVYGRQVTSIGLSETLMTAAKPVDLFWQDGKLVIESAQATTIKIKGKIITVKAGKNEITATLPGLPELKTLLQEAKTKRASIGIPAANKTSATPAAALKEVIHYNIGGSPIESIIINGKLLGIATGKTVNIFDEKGALVRKLITDGNIRVLRWWSEYKLLLVGCEDERVIAFDEQGNKKWEFISEMDRAVYDAGKQYWFKTAYPGVYGLYSGVFDNNKSRAFVGGACTLEIIDENGQLVKRLPLFWSVIRQFMMTKDAAGNNNLLVGGWQTGTNDLAVFGSKEMAEISRGFNDVPKGHSLVAGWMNMNRFDNFLVDMNNDGSPEVVSAINGAWNRITVYNAKGAALYNCQIGPGVTHPRTNIRMTDVADLDNDGQYEIITGLGSGFINVLDHKTNKKWSKLLPVPPVVVKVIREGSNNWICVGSEDGNVIAMDANGKIIGQGAVSGKPVDIQVVQTAAGPLAVITSDKGEGKGFRLAANSMSDSTKK